MFRRKKKLAELERRVERVEKFIDEIVCAEGEVIFSNTTRHCLISENALADYSDLLIGEPPKQKSRMI